MLLNTLKWTGVGIVVGAWRQRHRRDGSTRRQPAAAGRLIRSKWLEIRRRRMRSTPRRLRPQTPRSAQGRVAQRNEVAPIADLRKDLVKAALMEWEEALGRFYPITGRAGAGLSRVQTVDGRRASAGERAR